MKSKSKLLIIMRREYLKIIRSKTFWLSALMIPVLIGVIGGVEYISGNQLQEKLKNASQNAKLIYIIDDAEILNTSLPYFIQPQIKETDNIGFAINAVKNGSATAAIHYPKEILTSSQITIYSIDQGLLSRGQYDDLATNLLRQSILADIKNKTKVALFNASLSFDEHYYANGEETNVSLGTLVVPFVSIIIYFLFTSFATNYLLMSVSEEKENRMIEIILSSVSSRQLIWGKILGQVGVIVTQMVILIVFGAIAMSISKFNLPFDLGQIVINPWQIILALVYILCGFLILANTMVGAGAAMPNYKDAQSFSTIFILLSIFPIYTAEFIVADPNGLLAYVLSYFPYSAPLILLLRNALGAVGPVEVIISFIVLAFYIFITAVIAYKLFAFGALEYNQKISFSNFFKSLRIKGRK